MGTHSRSEMVSVHGTPCAIPPRNSNGNSKIPEDSHLQWSIVIIIITIISGSTVLVRTLAASHQSFRYLI
jgi:hypothetical protein